METLKFLMVNSVYPPHGIGGDANHVQQLSAELAKKGHEVHVIYNIDAYNLLSKTCGLSSGETKTDFDNIFVHTLKSPYGMIDAFSTYSIGKSKYYHNQYIKILSDVLPDVVHLHDVTFLGYDFLKKEENYISLYTAHNYWFICPNRELMRFGQICNKPSLCSLCLLNARRPPQLWRHGKAFKKIVANLDTIIAPSEFIKTKISEKFDTNMVHIPNFVSLPPIKIKECEYTNYFLYAGKLEYTKGVMDLLYVFKQYSNKINSKLIIVGIGTLDEKIKKFINKNNLQYKIIFLGFVDNETLWSLYKGALALIVPSVWPEVFGLVAIEAMSVGTPVICSDSGGISEIVNKLDKKLIFNSGNIEQLGTILMDYNRTTYRIDDIKNICKMYYSIERYMEKYTTLVSEN